VEDSEDNQVDWGVPKFLKVSGETNESAEANGQFECKCEVKLNSGEEVNEHFKSCYQMFIDYGNIMKSFISLKEAASSEPKLQNNLRSLLTFWKTEVEEAFKLKSLDESVSMEFRSDRGSAMRLPVPRNYIQTSPSPSANPSFISANVTDFDS